MAVFTVTAAAGPRPDISVDGVSVAAMQAAGGGPDTTFVIDFLAAKTRNASMRGRTLAITPLGTAFASIAAPQVSLDGVNYSNLRGIQPATISANTVESILGPPAVTSGTTTFYVAGQDFRFLKFACTTGDATSGLLVAAGN